MKLYRWEEGSSPDSPGRLIFPPSYKREVPVEVSREEERRRRVCGEEKEEGNMRRRKINRKKIKMNRCMSAVSSDREQRDSVLLRGETVGELPRLQGLSHCQVAAGGHTRYLGHICICI